MPKDKQITKTLLLKGFKPSAFEKPRQELLEAFSLGQLTPRQVKALRGFVRLSLKTFLKEV